MLTLVTAAIHFTFAFPTAMFLASAAGYVVLLVAFFLPALASVQRWVGAALALFAVGNIAAWYVMGPRIPLAYADKLAEVALVAALAVYLVQSRRPAAVPVRIAPPSRR